MKTKTRKKYKLKDIDGKINDITIQWEKTKKKLKKLKAEKKKLVARKDKLARKEIETVIEEKGWTVDQAAEILKSCPRNPVVSGRKGRKTLTAGK